MHRLPFDRSLVKSYLKSPYASAYSREVDPWVCTVRNAVIILIHYMQDASVVGNTITFHESKTDLHCLFASERANCSIEPAKPVQL